MTSPAIQQHTLFNRPYTLLTPLVFRKYIQNGGDYRAFIGVRDWETDVEEFENEIYPNQEQYFEGTHERRVIFYKTPHGSRMSGSIEYEYQYNTYDHTSDLVESEGYLEAEDWPGQIWVYLEEENDEIEI